MNPKSSGVEITDNGGGSFTVTVESGTPDFTFRDRSDVVSVNTVGCTNLPSNCFYNCTIREFTADQSLTTIGSYAFYKCNNLETITTPSMSKIEDNSFSFCTKLKTLSFPESMTYIGDSCFTNCTQITDLSFGGSITHCGSSCFSNCDSLINLTFNNIDLSDNSLSGITSIENFVIKRRISKINSANMDPLKNYVKKIEINQAFPDEIFGKADDYEYANSGWSTVYNTNTDLFSNFIKLEFFQVNTNFYYADRIFNNCPLLTHFIIRGSFCHYIFCWDVSECRDRPYEGARSFQNTHIKYIEVNKFLTVLGSDLNWLNDAIYINISHFYIPDEFGSKGYSGRPPFIPLSQNVKEIYASSRFFYYIILPNDLPYLNILTINRIDYSDELGYTYRYDIIQNSNPLLFLNCSNARNLKEVRCANKSYEFDIGSYGFYNCYNLEVIDPNINISGEWIFYNCSKLREISVSGTLLPNAISNCENLKLIHFNNVSLEGTSCISECPNLEILDFSKVSSFSTVPNSFLGLKNITVLHPLRLIGSNWMNEIENVSVILPKGLSNVNNNAFSNCHTLVNIDIQDVTTIEERAFYSCTSLKYIKHSNHIIQISDYAFWKCTSLFEFQFGDQIQTIGSCAFAYNIFHTITIPSSIQTISSQAFIYSSNLDTVIFMKSPSIIETQIFSSCNLLKNITFVSSDSDVEIAPSAFSDNPKLEYVRLPSTLKTLGDSSFMNCVALPTITIPDSVTTINNKVFTNCKTLTSIQLSNTLTTIGESVFMDCTSLPSIIIPNSVTSIGTTIFKNCISLTNIELSNNLATISVSAFMHCTSLPSITIPNSVTTIDNSAFIDCTSLRSIQLSNSLITIGSKCFYNCAALDQLTIPDSVEIIDTEAFSKCNSLSSIVLSSSLREIRSSAFFRCTNLNNVVIPNSVQTIGTNAFMNCENMKTFTFNNNIRVIETSLFENCYHLETITLPTSTTTIKNRAFYSCRDLETVIMSDGVTDIQEESFSQCTSLKNINLPKYLRQTKRNIFNNCQSLTNITFPENIDRITSFTLAYCSNLLEITISPNCQVLTDAFKGCINIKTIKVGGNAVFSTNCFDSSINRSINIYYKGVQDTTSNDHRNEVNRIYYKIFAGCGYKPDSYCDITVGKPTECSPVCPQCPDFPQCPPCIQNECPSCNCFFSAIKNGRHSTIIFLLARNR